MMKETYQCAWCSKVIGSTFFCSDETKEVISHTICERCKQEVLEDAAYLRSKKLRLLLSNK